MAHQKIDGAMLSEMIKVGAHHLTNQVEKIDALNVFPVPDGDTGTNMNLSMTSGVNEVKNLKSNNASEVAQAFAKGLLMGARGNSGVILSQLFRGFAKGLEHKSEVTSKDLAFALDMGVKTAYKAVIKPVEGTILTVAKEAAQKAVKMAEEEQDVSVLMESVLNEAKASLARTPDLLPVLKEVGVVDSGGQGLVTIYEGFVAALKGEALPEDSEEVDIDVLVQVEHSRSAQHFMNTEDIKYGYCTEFLVKFEADKLANHPFDEQQFRDELSEYGDSIVVVSDEDVVKIHIHTEVPGEVMTIGQRYGSLTNIDIQNMREQHSAIVNQSKPEPKAQAEYGIVTVAMGSGVKALFESLGANVIIEGGQTMNPSTQDIAEAIKEAHAKHIFILPNNKNIIMAAEQAAQMAECHVEVIPTKTIPQGMSALFAFMPTEDVETNKSAMIEAIEHVKTGQVTYAVRDTKFDEIDIKKGHFMGIADGKIKASHPDKATTAKQLITELVSEDDDILTIIYGEDVSEADVNELVDYAESLYEDLEVEVHHGNQPIYSYIFSVE